jgi:hypothetical protein
MKKRISKVGGLHIVSLCKSISDLNFMVLYLLNFIRIYLEILSRPQKSGYSCRCAYDNIN